MPVTTVTSALVYFDVSALVAAGIPAALAALEVDGLPRGIFLDPERYAQQPPAVNALADAVKAEIEAALTSMGGPTHVVTGGKVLPVHHGSAYLDPLTPAHPSSTMWRCWFIVRTCGGVNGAGTLIPGYAGRVVMSRQALPVDLDGPFPADDRFELYAVQYTAWET